MSLASAFFPPPPPPSVFLESLTTLCFLLQETEREEESMTAKNLHKIAAFRCAFSIRRSEMNVLYISADCGGVNQSSLLHAPAGPVDGARALLETRAATQGRSVTFYPLPPFHLLVQVALKSSFPRIRDTSFLPLKGGGGGLNKHVLASQINLLQKFQVKNNF